VRLGNHNDCCIGYGYRDSGEYSLFPTDTYDQLKKNVPEFEALTAMQAGLRSDRLRPGVTERKKAHDRSGVSSFPETTSAPSACSQDWGDSSPMRMMSRAHLSWP
jgi:hypothetical protein